MTKRRDLVGIGGWLGLLILWMVLLRPLAGAIMWKRMHAAGSTDPSLPTNSTWLINTSVFWVMILGVATLSIYGGLRLWRDRTPGAISAAILILWISSPIAAVALLISEAYLKGGVAPSNAASTLGINFAVAAAWTAYLKRSKRVRETYFQVTSA